jgi:hypothetical protein
MSPSLLMRGYDSCCKCGVEFKVGDDVVSKSRNHTTKRYHQKCYNEMYLEV